LQGDDESLPPRARALAEIAVTLTARPWELTPEAVAGAGRHGLDEQQIEASITVISMFNYFTRVADATGIEFDYKTPLPSFEPDLRQAAASRPRRPSSPASGAGRGRQRPRHEPLLAAWESWRAYVLEAEKPISRGERRLLAIVAAQESGDWEGAGALGELSSPADSDNPLTRFARKLSRRPWAMEASDLAELRAAGYSEDALLHIVSVVAHQNADSRLDIGLSAAGQSPPR
jgi:alkylhydroperoxidase family enzyme